MQDGSLSCHPRLATTSLPPRASTAAAAAGRARRCACYEPDAQSILEEHISLVWNEEDAPGSPPPPPPPLPPGTKKDPSVSRSLMMDGGLRLRRILNEPRPVPWEFSDVASLPVRPGSAEAVTSSPAATEAVSGRQTGRKFHYERSNHLGVRAEIEANQRPSSSPSSSSSSSLPTNNDNKNNNNNNSGPRHVIIPPPSSSFPSRFHFSSSSSFFRPFSSRPEPSAAPIVDDDDPGPLPVFVVGYYFCDEPIPYRTTIYGRTRPTLGRFKQLLTTTKTSVCKRDGGHLRYFFKRASDEFEGGVVREEITDDATVLPLWDGKIICKIERSVFN